MAPAVAGGTGMPKVLAVICWKHFSCTERGEERGAVLLLFHKFVVSLW